MCIRDRVIPSLYEGFGFAVGEAMACKKPVVTTDGGAIPEVISDCGIVVEAGNSDELKIGILKLINNESLKAEMAEKGYQRVLEALNWRRAAESVTEIYENAIKDFQK